MLHWLNREALTRTWHRSPRVTGWAVITATFGLWTAIAWSAARAQDLAPTNTRSWVRFDSNWYLFIVDDGYTFGSCDDVIGRQPTDYCGSAGWFPGYPYLIRGLGSLGLSHDTAGRAVAVVCFAATLAVLWFAFLRFHTATRGLLGMALAAVFPGMIYYGAVFPISIVTLSAMGALALMRKERWLLAGLCGAVGAVCYPSGAVVAVAALALLLTRGVGDMRSRWRAAVSVAGPIVIGYAMVLLNYRGTVGRWDAWFKVQAGYGYEATLPMITIGRYAKALITGSSPRWIGGQTMVVVVIVLLAAVVAARRWASLDIADRAAALMVAAWWLMPLTLGGGLSLYRAEALLLPVVVLLVRTHKAALMAITAVCAVIAYQMAVLFFASVIV